MKAVNPAVINHRPHGHAALKGNKDQVDKYQKIDETNNIEGKTDIGVTTYSAFYGGKGGGLFSG